MPQNNAKELLAKVTNDKGLAAKLRAAGKGGFSKFAGEQGLQCTYEEFKEAAKLAATTHLHERIDKSAPDAIVGVGSIGVI